MSLHSIEEDTNKKRRSVFVLFQWIMSFVVSVLFLLLYSNTTSPFTNYYGEDSAFYAMVGAGMKHGLLPYRDFYEMKGPYMFWIQYLGQLISEDRFGTFCIQTVNMTLTIGIILLIVNLALKDCKMSACKRFLIHFSSVVFSLFMISLTFEGGNLTEEFSYPVLVLCLYLCLRYFDEQKKQIKSDHSLIFGFIYGMAFGYFAFIRIINAAFLGAVLLTITIYLISKKNWKNILQNAIVFISGTIVCMLPACIWAFIQGIFNDMIQEVYILAFSYSTELDTLERVLLLKNFIWPMIMISIIPILILLIFLKRDWKLWFLSASSAIILFIAVSMGDGYLHYFSLQLPNVVLSVYIFITCCKEDNSKEKWKKILKYSLSVIAICICILLQKQNIQNKTIYIAKESIKSVLNGNPQEFDVAYINEIMDYIPDNEKDSIYLYGFGSCSQWYAKAGIFPPNRYCDWQPHWIILYPEIGLELQKTIASKELIWIVLPAGQNVWPDEINDAIFANYYEYYSNEFYSLFHCNE